MKQTDATMDDFFEGIPESIPAMDAGDLAIPYEVLSQMMIESLVVLDLQRKAVYIPGHDLSLSGYTHETLQGLGYDFFKKVIHPEDLSFWISTHNAIVDSLNNDELPANEINYFSFLLRIKSSILPPKESSYFLFYVKLKPRWVDERLHYGVCMLSASIMQKPDHQLRVHYYNWDYSDYSLNKKQWTYHPFSPLSLREREMLAWAQQGLSVKKTAEKMNVSSKAVESIRKGVFEKLGVNTIDQAIKYASNRLMIYHFPPAKPEAAIKEKALSPPSPKKRNRLSAEDLCDIQKDLDQGKSVNAIAKSRKKPESTIRNAITQGKTVKRSH